MISGPRPQRSGQKHEQEQEQEKAGAAGRAQKGLYEADGRERSPIEACTRLKRPIAADRRQRPMPDCPFRSLSAPFATPSLPRRMIANEPRRKSVPARGLGRARRRRSGGEA
jgi:hypothetical protein